MCVKPKNVWVGMMMSTHIAVAFAELCYIRPSTRRWKVTAHCHGTSHQQDPIPDANSTTVCRRPSTVSTSLPGWEFCTAAQYLVYICFMQDSFTRGLFKQRWISPPTHSTRFEGQHPGFITLRRHQVILCAQNSSAGTLPQHQHSGLLCYLHSW
jgi:hypothetical protein